MSNQLSGFQNIGRYNLLLIFNIISTILFYLFLPLFFIERVIHKKSKGWKEKFGFCDTLDGKTIMIHGCSVGEINAAENLIKKIKEQCPEYKLLITTSTITGQNIAKEKFSKIADYITYFPFDTVFETKRFINRINPTQVYIIETEIWPCFAYTCKKNNIPLYIINGRISDKAFKKYKIFKYYFKHVLKNYTGIFTQSNEDSEKFISIGAELEKIQFMGNLKFDIQKSNQTIDIGGNGYKVLIAGSTHNVENKIVIEVYDKLKKKYKNLKLIIAPRHLERVSDIEFLCKKYKLNYVNRSKNGVFSEINDILILDTLGELGKLYSAWDIAYIGGSLSKTGGHNPLEASIWNKPVITGKNINNFKDIYGILITNGAAKKVDNKEELYKELDIILGDDKIYENMSKACENVFEKQKHVTDFVIDVMKKL